MADSPKTEHTIDWNAVVAAAKQKLVQSKQVETILDELWTEHVTATEEESQRAKELVLWYVNGKGRQFERTDGEWGRFMRNRPEVKRALRTFLGDERRRIRASGKNKGPVRGVVSVDLGGDAMNLTLNIGSVYIAGSYETQANGSVSIAPVQLTWIDEGDLHPDTKATGLKKYAAAINDSYFVLGESILRAMGKQPGRYPIRISWQMADDSNGNGDGTPTAEEPGGDSKPASHTCRAPCKDFKTYGLCDRRVKDEYGSCYQH